MKRGQRTRRLLQAMLAAAALGALTPNVIPPLSYQQDVQVPFLMASALRDGTDLYAPLSDLSERHLPERTNTFPHPSPHPPLMALLGVPLILLPYALVPPILLAMNVAALLYVGRSLRLSWQASLAMAAWPPVWCLLAIGQLEILLLASLVRAWRSADEGKDFTAGVWIGFWGALKLYPLLYLMPFVARRRFRLIVGGALAFGAAQATNLALAGYDDFRRYYLEVLPTVADRYSSLSLNSAPYGALMRLFGGAGDVVPFLSAPEVALPITLLISAAGALSLFWLKPRAAPIAGLVTLPSVWYYHAVLAVPQVVVLLRSRLWKWCLLACAAASMTTPLANVLLDQAGLSARHTNGSAATILMSIQCAGFLGWFLLSLILRDDENDGWCDGKARTDSVTVQ